MPITTAALTTEINTDPGARGYAAHVASKADNAIAAILNAVDNAINIDRGVIPSYEVINATVHTEWAAMSAAEKQRYQTMTGAGQVDSANANVRAAFNQMFAGATGAVTRAALIALLTRKGSRAEQLGGAGTVVADQDVARALGRG